MRRASWALAVAAVLVPMGLAACGSSAPCSAATLGSEIPVPVEQPRPGVPGVRDAGIDLMSFNIRNDNPDDTLGWDKRLGPIVTMVEEQQPDVIGIQEGRHHQVQELAEGLTGYTWFGAGRDDGRCAGEFTAIFYRADEFTLLSGDTFWLSDTPDEPSVGWDAALERIVTWAELRRIGGGHSFFVFNTHFDHEGVVARQESASLLADTAAGLAADRPVFVLGDLNVSVDDSALTPLLDLYDSARATAPITDNVASYNGFQSPHGIAAIDFILLGGATAEQFETIDDDFGVDYISDHYPIVASVTCPGCG